MPPQISEDEGSASDYDSNKSVKEEKEKSLPVRAPEKAKGGRPKKVKAEAVVEPKDEDVEDEADEDDEEEQDEDVYVVEKILSHVVDESGTLQFEVKWEGFDKKADRTWEPESNLETATEVLTAYIDSVGGREALLEGFDEKKPKGKKHGRASEGAVNGSAKKTKKSTSASESPAPASKAKIEKEWEVPSGNWEESVSGIDACEGNDGEIVVFITWTNGKKTQHPLAQVYKRCPQKMLKFYESHLVFKKTDIPDE